MPELVLEPIARQVTKSDLLALLAEVGGLDRRRVGRIQLEPPRAIVEVPAGWEDRLARQLSGAQLHGRAIRAHSTTPGARPGDNHFRHLTRLLQQESQAQAEQTRAEALRGKGHGRGLADLVVNDEDTGLGGRPLAEFVRRQRTPLGYSRLNTGTPIVCSPDQTADGPALRGVVLERGESSIWLAFHGSTDALAEYDRWRIDVSTDEIATARATAALDRAARSQGNRLAQLRAVLLGETSPRFAPVGDVASAASAIEGLNEVQRQMVDWALGAQDVALVHGPPGTGKTTTLVAIIAAAVAAERKVLVTAPSNLAVDNLLERLLTSGVRAIRLGHPARVMPELRAHTLDLLVAQHHDVRLARQLVKDARQLFRQAARYTRAKPAPGARADARAEARSLLADARRLEAQAVAQLLDQADVLCATNTALDDDLLGTRQFDLAVIDEACQAVEPDCWIPTLRADRLILAGDHCQLPPTVVSPEAKAAGLGQSLFERLMAMHGATAARTLTVQYRMHDDIMQFSNQEFYAGALSADAAVVAHTLAELSGLTADEVTCGPLEFIDTAGAGYDEQQEPGGESRLNPAEGAVLVRRARALLERGLPPEQLALITPYSAQVRWLREQLADVPALEIDSVDGFQGREKEAVLISLVRSNPEGQLGFLNDTRRTNVALTRARRKLIVVGDSATLAHHPFYQRMLDYFEARGAYHTVWEEL